MKPEKILYVDDEAMALKYFERLVSPMAPVLTALSVEEGKEILRTRGGEIAVLVSDQRMPGARGNELLRYARDNHPAMVRMLTTAYSELGEAIEAINAGEIYRYITKPWDLESLRADLGNALELSGLRAERDGLLREKMLVQQQQLLASRITELAIACAGFVATTGGVAGNRPLYTYLHSVMEVGCAPPPIDWHLMDHADLMQAEAHTGCAAARWFRAARLVCGVADRVGACAAPSHGGARRHAAHHRPRGGQRPPAGRIAHAGDTRARGVACLAVLAGYAGAAAPRDGRPRDSRNRTPHHTAAGRLAGRLH
jgi:CheY-like chemotaxis protein